MAKIPPADTPIIDRQSGRISLEWYTALQRLVSEIVALGAGGVVTFEGRSGAVVSASGDYTASEITNVAAGNVAAVTVQAAIDELDTEKQPIDATLTALAAFNTNGLLAQTAADTFAGRTLTGTANEISVADGDGVSGNPVLSLPATIDLGGKTSLEIPNSAAPTVNADGEIAVDTSVTDFSHGILKYYSSEELGVIAMPIAQFSSPTDGHVVAYNGTNDEFVLSAASGSGGAWVKIASTTASASATIDFTGLSSTYIAYAVVIANLVPATDNTDLLMRTDENNGASFDSGASDYKWSYFAMEEDGTFTSAADTADSEMQLSGSVGNAGEESLSGIVWLWNPANAAAFYSSWQLVRLSELTAHRADYGGGSRSSVTTAIDAVRFLMSSGNITSGTFTLYGIAA